MRLFKQIFIIISTGVLMALLGACQSNPSQDTIDSKTGGALIEQLDAQNVFEYSKDEYLVGIKDRKWVEQYSDGVFSCSIDAQIIVPDEMRLPVYLIEKDTFSIEKTNDIVGLFTDRAVGARENYLTKEELEAQLIAVKRGALVEDDGVFSYVPYEGQDEEIEDLMNQIAEVPEERFDRDLLKVSEIPGIKIYRTEEGERIFADYGRRYVYVSLYNINTILMQRQSWITEYASPLEPNGVIIDNVIIDRAQAEKKANDLFENLKLENIEIGHMEYARLVNTFTNETISKGWIVVANQNFGNGVPMDLISLDTNGVLNFAQEEYNERWRPETISAYIDEEGVKGFYWSDPIKVISCMNAGVELLPFKEVQEKIKMYLKYGYDRSKIISSGEETGMTVTKIVLSNLGIPAYNQPSKNMLVPAWVVFYEMTEGPLAGDEYVFAINAVDGSIIDLVLRSREWDE